MINLVLSLALGAVITAALALSGLLSWAEAIVPGVLALTVA